LKKTLTQYQLFSLYLSNEIQKHSALPWYKNMDISTFVSQPFYNSYLRNFNQFFNEWLHEMSYNQRSFNPYNLQADESNLFEMVKGIKPKIGFLEKGGKNYSRYNFLLTNEERNLKNNSASEQRFMDLFHTTTEKLVKEKFNF